MIVELHLLSTWMMIGIMWFIQLVHYPLFSFVKRDFLNYEREHVVRVSYIVVPVMMTELATAFVILWQPVNMTVAWWNLGLLLLIWITTFFIQGKIHRKLVIKRSPELIEKLVRSNWIRTVLWTTRGFLVFLL